MEKLIERLRANHDLSEEQARGIINTVTEYLIERFPMISGAVDNFFSTEDHSHVDASDNHYMSEATSTPPDDILE